MREGIQERRREGGVGLNYPTAQPGAEENRRRWKVPEQPHGLAAVSNKTQRLREDFDHSCRIMSLHNPCGLTARQIGVQTSLSPDLQ